MCLPDSLLGFACFVSSYLLTTLDSVCLRTLVDFGYLNDVESSPACCGCYCLVIDLSISVFDLKVVRSLSLYTIENSLSLILPSYLNLRLSLSSNVPEPFNPRYYPIAVCCRVSLIC